MRLQDKSAIVTGAGRGIGRAIALKLAREGARVCLADLDADNAAKVAEEIVEMGRQAFVVRTDIAYLTQVSEMMQKAVSILGVVDILVNNAGWDKAEPFLQSEEQTWDKVIAINFRGPINCFKAVLPHMVERRYGKIISVASDAGRVGSSGEAVYSGAKGGIIAFSKTIAREVARFGISVNCVAPGPTETDLFNEMSEDNPKLLESLKKAIPLKRIGQPEDIANAVAFLASDEGSFITGQTLSVSGGLTMV